MKKHPSDSEQVRQIHIGCASFYNSYWKEIFYPKELPSKQWFDYYCQHFDTFEINATFYKFPTLRVMQNWYNKAPDNFLYSVKAPKHITHFRRFVDCKVMLEQFYTAISEGLQHKLACVLFQLPPSYQYNAENLEFIISQLDLNFKNVIEFRHESWWIPEVVNELSKYKITMCSVSYPKLPETIFTESPLVYVRLHGVPKLFYSEYSSEQLTILKKSIEKDKAVKSAFIYFNNTASTAGISNAMKMKELF